MKARSRIGVERGIVLLAMLFVLLGTSSLWLAHSMPSPSATAVTAVAGLERRRRAREALLAHATLYPWIYGPTGAGPGHLPCPDTDALQLQPGDRQRAGPDPPCAARPAAQGALPLHVTVGTQRSALDPSGVFSGALGYRVSAAVVNNPQGRPVDGTLELAEVLSIDARPAGNRAFASAFAVDSIALLDPVERGVAAWTIDRLHELPATAAGSLCRSEPPCRLLDALRRDDAATPDVLLEAVPLVRHWFVRNGWNDDIELRVDDACRRSAMRCRWATDERARRTARREPGALLPPLRLRLAPRDTALDPAITQPAEPL